MSQIQAKFFAYEFSGERKTRIIYEEFHLRNFTWHLKTVLRFPFHGIFCPPTVQMMTNIDQRRNAHKYRTFHMQLEQPSANLLLCDFCSTNTKELDDIQIQFNFDLITKLTPALKCSTKWSSLWVTNVKFAPIISFEPSL